jgi:hypothetical protein
MGQNLKIGKMGKKIVYIMGKVTGLAAEEAKANFQAYENELREMGHSPINPLKIVPEWATPRMAIFMCLNALSQADAVCPMENWTDSDGAQIEMRAAIYSGMEIIVLAI